MVRQKLNRSIDARQVPPLLARASGGNPDAVVIRSEINALTPEDIGADYEGSAIEAANYAINTGNSRLPVQYFGFWFLGKVLSGGAIGATKNTGYTFGVGWAQASPKIGDEVQFQMPLAEGSYRLILEGVRGIDTAQQTIFVNEVNLGLVDWYNSSTVYGAQLTKDFTLFSRLQTIKFKVTGKNASSTNYNARISHLIINRL